MPCVAEPDEYSEKLQRKLLELRELVEANIVESTTPQQRGHHCQETARLLVGQKVLVSNPTRGKLDPHWTGPWVVIRQLDNTSMKVRMGTREQVIINQIRPFHQEDTITIEPQIWTPPLFSHHDVDEDNERVAETDPCIVADDSHIVKTTRSGREIHPVDYYGY